MLNSEDRITIINYRLEKAKQSLKEAKAIARLGYWNLVGNRLYYTVYYASSALILDKGFKAKTHSGIIALIGEKFILPGLLDRKYGQLFSRLFSLRQAGDYDDMFDATESEVMSYFHEVENYLEAVGKLLTFGRNQS